MERVLEPSTEMLAIEKDIAVAVAKAEALEAAVTTNNEGYSCYHLTHLTFAHTIMWRRQLKNARKGVKHKRRIHHFKSRQSGHTLSHLPSCLSTTHVSVLKAAYTHDHDTLFHNPGKCKSQNPFLTPNEDHTPSHSRPFNDDDEERRLASPRGPLLALTVMLCSPFMELIPTWQTL